MRFPTFQNRAETCARVCAVALGFSIPISVALDNLLLGLILVSWLAAGNYRERLAVAVKNKAAFAAFSLFGLLAAGSIYSSANYGDSLNMLGKYLDLAFVPIFVSLFRDERARRQAWLALAFALAFTVIVSYLAWLGLSAPNYLIIGDRGNPVVFKQYLTQSVLLGFGTLLFAQLARTTQSMPQRYGWWALAALSAANVAFMNHGRTGQLILVTLLLYLVYSLWGRRGALAATAGILIVTGVLILGAGDISGRFAQAFDEGKNWRPGHAAQTSTAMRLEFYRNTIDIARKHALVGTGTGSFSKVYADHVAGTAMTATENPHNEYLNIAIQLGIVGVLALLYVFYCEWRFAAALPTAYERDLARGLVITFVVGCLFNSLLVDHTEGLFFAWVSGLLFAGLKSPQIAGAPSA